jgi:muramidase (phage lysozyme)
VLPKYVVVCESKETNEGPNGPLLAAGYYQIIPSTWEAYGGKPPNDASKHSKAEQDRVALNILHNSPRGLGEWSCA